MNSLELSPLENFAKELFEVREKAWPCHPWGWDSPLLTEDCRKAWRVVAGHVLNLQANEKDKAGADLLNRLHDLRVLSQDLRRQAEKARRWQVVTHLAASENELTGAIAKESCHDASQTPGA